MWKHLSNRSALLFEWVASSLLDVLSLAAWVLVQWVFERFVKGYALSNLGELVVQVFQAILAVGTLAVPIVFIYSDVVRMVRQARLLPLSDEKQELLNTIRELTKEKTKLLDRMSAVQNNTVGNTQSDQPDGNVQPANREEIQ